MGFYVRTSSLEGDMASISELRLGWLSKADKIEAILFPMYIYGECYASGVLGV